MSRRRPLQHTPPRSSSLCVPSNGVDSAAAVAPEFAPPDPLPLLPMFSEPPVPPGPSRPPPIPRPRCGPAARCANGGERSGAPSGRFHRPQHSLTPARPLPRPGMEPGAPAEPRCRLEPWLHYEPGPAVLCTLGCVLGLLYGCVGEGWGWHSAGGAPPGVGGGDTRGRLWGVTRSHLGMCPWGMAHGDTMGHVLYGRGLAREALWGAMGRLHRTHLAVGTGQDASTGRSWGVAPGTPWRSPH